MEVRTVVRILQSYENAKAKPLYTKGDFKLEAKYFGNLPPAKTVVA